MEKVLKEGVVEGPLGHVDIDEWSEVDLIGSNKGIRKQFLESIKDRWGVPESALELSNGETLTELMLGPKGCADLRRLNDLNRRLRKEPLKKYVSDMQEGRWYFIADTMIVDANYFLRQGHHRLSAAIETGKTLRVLLVENVDLPPRVFAAVDDTTRRRLLDVMTSTGLFVDVNPQYLERAVKLFHKLQVGNKQGGSITSTTKGYELAHQYPAIVDSLYWVENLQDRGTIFTEGTVAGFMAAFQVVDGVSFEKAQEFWEPILSGNTKAGTPQRALYSKARRLKEKSELSDKLQRQYVLKAWDYFRVGKSIKRLRRTE